ncbi:MAG TPA: hypothetical protein H9903_02410 [Candidatus Aquabacterium excrementipullorum]|nr:hypothetical protein [Candidatus Aquabacterium excrementipullorum]
MHGSNLGFGQSWLLVNDVLMKTFKLAALAATLSVSLAHAESQNNGSGDGRGSPPQASAEMKAAFEACQTKGKPGDQAFEDCMTSKGFKKPDRAQKPPRE